MTTECFRRIQIHVIQLNFVSNSNTELKKWMQNIKWRIQLYHSDRLPIHASDYTDILQETVGTETNVILQIVYEIMETERKLFDKSFISLGCQESVNWSENFNVTNEIQVGKFGQMLLN